MEKQFILRFKGDKIVLHKQLKMKSVEENVSMNSLVINYIQNGLCQRYTKKLKALK